MKPISNVVGALLCTGVLLLVPASPGTAQEQVDSLMTSGADPSAGTLRPGDLVSVSVWRRDELSGSFRVNSEGGLDHPLYREVIVADVPLETAEERLRSYLRTLESDPQFAMRPFFRISVAGEVGSPGMYDLPPETSIAEAVAQAGGFSQAAKGEVELVRGFDRIEMDLRDPRSPGATMTIRSGDQIQALRRGNFNFMSHVFFPLLSTASAVASIINLTQ